MSPTWSTTSDWDNSQSESGVHHEQPTGTDWAASDTVEKGFPTDWSKWSIPTPDSFWPCQDGSGPIADVIGGYDLDLNDATLGLTPAPLGNTALDMPPSGSSPPINSNYPDITAGNPQSVGFMFKTTVSGDRWNTDIMSHSDGGDGWGILLDSNDTVSAFTQGSNNVGTSGTVVNDGSWYWILFVFDQPNDTLRFDINGVTDKESTGYTDDSGTTSSSFTLSDVPGGNNVFEFDISHIVYWRNYAVTKTESTNLYEAFV